MERLRRLFLFTFLVAMGYYILHGLLGLWGEHDDFSIEKILRFCTGVFYLGGVGFIYRKY